MRRIAIVLLCLPTALWAQAEPKPQRPSGPLAEAKQRWLRGNNAEARAAFEKLLDKEATRTQAAIGVARTYLSEGNHPRALSSVDDAIKNGDKSPELMAFRAELLFDSGKWEEANTIAEAVIKESPENFRARWVRAQFLRDTGDLAKADVEMRWFVRTYTRRDNDDKPITDPEELHFVGLAGSENARWHGLGDQFRFMINDLYPDVLKFDPDDWRAEYQIGRLLLEKYNRPEAMQAFENALKINPKAAEAMVGKGQISLQQFEIKEADIQADLALKANPGLTSALRLKADVMLAGGELKEAAALMERARAINPRDELTLARLAAAARMANDKAGVEAIVKSVEQFNAKPGMFYHELASALEDRKIYGDAEKYFEKSIAMRDKLPAAKAGLGMLYLRIGKETEARALLEQAFKSDTFNVRVSNSIKVLRHLDKYETVKTKHYDLRFDPKTDKLLAGFMAEYLEETHDILAKEFQYEPEGRILIELFNNHEMFSGRTVGLPDLHTIGACTGRVVTIASPKAKGVARPFNWGRVIRHELVHIFNLSQTEYLVPHWMTEGLAVRKEGGNRPPMWSAVLRDRFQKNDLLNLDNILVAFVRPKDQLEWSLAYCQSHLYVEYLIATYGIESIGPMLNAFRDGLDTGAALKKVCKVEKADFEVGYRAYVEKVVRSVPSASKKADDKPMTLAELEKAHAADPKDVDVAARLADQYARRKKAADARKLADQVLEAKPGHPLASVVKARLLEAAGDEDGARLLIESASKANPDDPKLLLQIGRLALAGKDFARAAEVFEKGRKSSPLDGDWLPLLIQVYTKTEESEKLVDVLTEQVGNDPDDLGSRIKLARLLIDTKKFAEAEKIAWDATRVDVTNEEAQAVLLDALKGMGKNDVAERLKNRFSAQ